jgi:phosphoglycerate dehydrogenase-like enzyme
MRYSRLTDMNRHRTLFLTERSPRHQGDSLAAAPPELDVVIMRLPARDELWSGLATAEFLISERAGVIDAAMLEAAPHLRLIVRLGSLAYDIDLAAAAARGVAVTTWPVRGTIAVAEHCVLQMLALARRLLEVNAVAMAAEDWGEPRRTDENTFAYNWSGQQDLGSLWRRTVGILGFGQVGAELAQRLRGWDCHIIYHRRRRLPPQVEAALGIVYGTADGVLEESDFVVNLLPYASETEHALGAAQFARMKAGAFLVSCGSGRVIDEAALAEALRVGHLAGAALDTYEWEPLRPEDPLRQLALDDPTRDILLTPHIGAGAVPQGIIQLRAEDYVPIVQFLRGKPLPY